MKFTPIAFDILLDGTTGLIILGIETEYTVRSLFGFVFHDRTSHYGCQMELSIFYRTFKINKFSK